MTTPKFPITLAVAALVGFASIASLAGPAPGSNRDAQNAALGIAGIDRRTAEIEAAAGRASRPSR